MIHPGILVNLSPVIFTAVCSLFPDNLRFLHVLLVPDQQCAALSHTVIFRLMKAETAEISDGAQGSALVGGHNPLCCILYHCQMILFRNGHDCVHLTGHAGIMNRRNCPCALCHCIFYQFFINVHSIRPDIHEHRHGSSEHESIGSRHESIRRHNHLVSRFYIS